jgi:glycosyltransferase involved in cell wall biosynthesis
MNIVYVSLSYVPSRRASSIHVMKMCAALARAGHDVRLIAKRSHDPADAGVDAHAFYGVSGFAIDSLPRPRRRGGGLVFAAATLGALVARRHRTELVYSRDVIGALTALELRMPTVAEFHAVPHDPRMHALTRRIVRHRSLRGLVLVSDALRRDFIAHGLGTRHAPIIVAHDAADPPALGRIASTHAPAHRPRVGYVGNLYPGRGIELILEVAAHLPAYDFELVGGTEADLARWRAHALPPNVILAGFVRPAELAERYRGFDVVLMPYPRSGIGVATGASDTSRWCSPMKMFEYMATGAPIVTSDLPVLGEVLHHEHNALVAPAEDTAAWQRAIERLVTEPALARRLAQQAYADLVRDHTWDARVRRIFDELSLAPRTAPGRGSTEGSSNGSAPGSNGVRRAPSSPT